MSLARALAPLEALGALPALSWREKLAYLTYQFSRLPQIDCPIEHRFEEGRYIRVGRIPAGTLLIGRAHLAGHLIELLEGRVLHIREHDRHEREAPFAMHTVPACQMVVYAHTDVLYRTVHPNPQDSRDTQALEEAAFEPLETLMALGCAVRRRIERLRYLAMLRAVGLEREEARLHELCESTADQVEFPEPVGVRIGQSDIEGLGVLATRAFAPGERIAPARIGTARTPAGRYANHQDIPNARMQESSGEIVLIALRPIPADEEVTVDYRESLALNLQMRARALA